MSVSAFILVGLHTFLAWVLIEAFVNLCHRFRRPTYIFAHYSVIVLTFGALFSVYFRFFSEDASVFWVTISALAFLLFYELVVFRYLYSGERWFLNWADWIFPVFLALTTVYAAGVFLG